MKEQNPLEKVINAAEETNKNSAEKNWEGVSVWENESGTGKFAQMSALKRNLENFIPKIKATLSQTDLIEGDESVKKLVGKAKEFMEEFEKFKQ